MSSPLEWALWYARQGMRVLPIHSMRNGECSCGGAGQLGGKPCKPAKHPRTASGSLDASSDLDVVRRWWTQWPDANVAIVCGESSGVVAIDVDPRHAGDLSLEEWEGQRPGGPLPETWRQRTGGGGFHLVYKYPSGTKVRGRNPWLPGVEVKSNAGYILVAPSVHASGSPYVWETDFSVMPEPAQIPADVVASINQTSTGGGGSSGGGSDLPTVDELLKGVPDGERNTTLFRAACQMFRRLGGPGAGADEAVRLWIVESARASNFPEEEALECYENARKQDYSNDDWLRQMGLVKAWAEGAALSAEERAEALFPLTEDGNAWRYHRDWGRETLYVEAWGFLHWDGQKWTRDEAQLVRKRMLETTYRILEEVDLTDDAQQQAQIRAWARQAQASSKTDGAIKQLKPKLAHPVGSFDRDPWQLNCQNGVLNLRTGELRPHVKEDLFTMVASASYSPVAECPQWLAFLEKIVPDSDTRAFVQRAVGYSLSGSTQEKVMFILHGSGDNGKTVFIETLRAVLGDYAKGTPSQSLVNRKKDGVPNDIARLRGARMVTTQEPAAGGQLDVELVKEITGGDKMLARFFRQEWFEFTPEFKLWMSTNHEPVISQQDEATWKRIRLVPFTVSIPKHEQIPRDQLESLLLAEASGILRWALEGALAWQRELTLGDPAQVMLATQLYREEMDVMGAFLEEHVVQTGDNGDFVTGSQLYGTYKTWMEARGERPWGQSSFGRELSRRKLLAGKKGGARGFYGVRVTGTFVVPQSWG